MRLCGHEEVRLTFRGGGCMLAIVAGPSATECRSARTWDRCRVSDASPPSAERPRLLALRDYAAHAPYPATHAINYAALFSTQISYCVVKILSIIKKSKVFFMSFVDKGLYVKIFRYCQLSGLLDVLRLGAPSPRVRSTLRSVLVAAAPQKTKV